MTTSLQGSEPVSHTEILKWKDGKKAVFMLEFDDSVPSHVTTVVPELKKRGMIGTFYINPGARWFEETRKAWEEEIPATGMEYGNHSFTHVGALSVAEFDVELEKCNAEINKCQPDRKQPRLISFGRPGVPKEKWRITDEELKQLLAKHHLIHRQPFYGPPFRKDATEPEIIDEMMKVVDSTIAGGEMGHLDFHGVGGDWLAASTTSFVALLDKLDSCRDQLWITDPISWHKYATERDGAEVKLLESGPDQIRIQLTSTADPALYDLPLTLSTRVPKEWKECLVTQGSAKTTAPVVEGTVHYPATPGAAEITLRNQN